MSARLRFSPHHQPTKESAIELILEQLLLSDPGGLTPEQLQSLFHESSSGSSIDPHDLHEGLRRLEERGRVVSDPRSEATRYRIAEDAAQEAMKAANDAEQHLSRVLDDLFYSDQVHYREPFLSTLAHLFAYLGEESVDLISGGNMPPPSQLRFEMHIATALSSGKAFGIDSAVLERGLEEFIRREDPHFNYVKWQLAQSLYIAKVLGLDDGGRLLTIELFAGAQLFVDTNVLIPGLNESDPDHYLFLALCSASRQLNIKLVVSPETLEELERWVEAQLEILPKVADYIPKDLEPRLKSPFLERYRALQARGVEITAEALGEGYLHPEEVLSTTWGIIIDRGEESQSRSLEHDVEKFAAALQDRYRQRGLSSSHRKVAKRRKTPNAAVHDAILIKRVEHLRDSGDSRVWLITTDRSLPGAIPPGSQHKSMAISLESFLQWASPFTRDIRSEASFGVAFAEMMRRRLLPQDLILRLEDFHVFRDMQIAARELPAHDVERCIAMIRSQSARLDPSSPRDRETLFREIQRFFADPGRQYKREVERLTHSVEEARDYGRQLETTLEGQQETIGKLQAEIDLRTHRAFVLRRSVLVAVVWLLLCGAVVMGALQWGDGKNWFQQILGSWLYLSLAFAISTGLGRLLLTIDDLKKTYWFDMKSG